MWVGEIHAHLGECGKQAPNKGDIEFRDLVDLQGVTNYNLEKNNKTMLMKFMKTINLRFMKSMELTH